MQATQPFGLSDQEKPCDEARLGRDLQLTLHVGSYQHDRLSAQPVPLRSEAGLSDSELSLILAEIVQ